MFQNTITRPSILLLLFSILVFSCKSGQKDMEGKALPTVLVQMEQEITVLMLEEEFSKYGLQQEKMVSRPMHIYLFTYNAETITENKLIDLLRESPLVKEAQRNKNVQTRNND